MSPQRNSYDVQDALRGALWAPGKADHRRPGTAGWGRGRPGLWAGATAEGAGGRWGLRSGREERSLDSTGLASPALAAGRVYCLEWGGSVQLRSRALRVGGNLWSGPSDLGAWGSPLSSLFLAPRGTVSLHMTLPSQGGALGLQPLAGRWLSKLRLGVPDPRVLRASSARSQGTQPAVQEDHPSCLPSLSHNPTPVGPRVSSGPAGFCGIRDWTSGGGADVLSPCRAPQAEYTRLAPL